MTRVPNALRLAVTVLVVALVTVAVAGAATRGHHVLGAVFGALFVIIYLGAVVHISGAREPKSGNPAGHRWLVPIWLGALSVLWVAALLVSDNAMFLAFPLILLQIGVLGVRWGALAAALTAGVAAAVSLSRLAPGESPAGPILGPLVSGTLEVASSSSGTRITATLTDSPAGKDAEGPF